MDHGQHTKHNKKSLYKSDTLERIMQQRTQQQQQQQQQRIYIGGIDPDRLSVQEILDRFPNDTIIIQTIDYPKQGAEANGQHFHVNVVSPMASGGTGSTSDSSSSSSSGGDDKSKNTTTPLEILRKLFHNVTWKGCRLRVELARPHFLDRLAKEREQQQQQQQSKAVTAAEEAASGPAMKSFDRSFIRDRDECNEMKEADNGNNKEQQEQDEEEEIAHSCTIHRRHLKIRNRRGIPSGIGSKKDQQQQRQQSSSSSLVVDTKPHLVTDWKDFSQKLAMAKKHNTTTNKNNKNAKSTTTTKRPGRAVHLVFETTATTTTKRDNEVLKDEDFFQMEKKSVNENHNQNDDDSHRGSSSNSSSSSETKDVEKNVSDDASHDASLLGKNEERQKDAPSPAGKYVWSDDDDDSDSDSASDTNSGKRNLVQAPHGNMTTTAPNSLLVDEFASAINDMDDDDDDDESNEISQDGSTDNEQQQSQGVGDGEDLSRDVENNLSVLAQLFPDWTPKPVDDLSDKHGNENDRQQESHHSNQNMNNNNSQGDTTGWGAVNTLMQRYDPTLASAQQFLIKSTGRRDGNDKNDDSSSSNSISEGSRGEKPQEDSAVDAAAQNEDNDKEMKDLITEKEEAKDIYRQHDLEQVFREAREIGNKPPPVVVERKNAKGSNETGFSFAFDLGETNNQEEQLKQSPDAGDAFSFSFQLALNNAAAPGISVIGNNHTQTSPGGDNGNKVNHRLRARDDDDDDDNSGTKEEEDLRFKRRRGFSFPAQDLDTYVEGFYQLNDGKSIMDDLAGYRKDPRVKESWERKRKALTSDWKRKRKFAQSRNKQQKRAAP